MATSRPANVCSTCGEPLNGSASASPVCCAAGLMNRTTELGARFRQCSAISKSRGAKTVPSGNWAAARWASLIAPRTKCCIATVALKVIEAPAEEAAPRGPRTFPARGARRGGLAASECGRRISIRRLAGNRSLLLRDGAGGGRNAGGTR